MFLVNMIFIISSINKNSKLLNIYYLVYLYSLVTDNIVIYDFKLFINDLGWISILFEWKNHKNFRIQSWANRTLLNMDDEDPINGDYMFGKQTVLLYPKNRYHQDSKIDIVLVHGLLGGVSFSWREKDVHINEPLGLFGKYIIYYHQFILDLLFVNYYV